MVEEKDFVLQVNKMNTVLNIRGNKYMELQSCQIFGNVKKLRLVPAVCLFVHVSITLLDVVNKYLKKLFSYSISTLI